MIETTEQQLARLRIENRNMRRKLEEYRNEARRCRKLAAAMLDATVQVGAFVEITTHMDDTIDIAACVPSGDEAKIGRAICEEIARYFGSSLGETRTTGTLADAERAASEGGGG